MAAVFVTMASNGLGTIQANFGTYVPGSDGLFSVDTRDIPALLVAGASFAYKRNATYNSQIAVAAAAVGQFIASAALANGALSVANQPDVLRQGSLRIYAGTSAVTGGSVSVVYRANDGNLQTDTISAICGASGTTTNFLSKGIAHIVTASVSGIVGGTSPKVQLDTTASISVPVDPGAVDITFIKETIDSGDETVGTPSTVTLGTIAPTTAPNATHTYSLGYTFTAPTT